MLERRRNWSAATLVCFGHAVMLLLINELMSREPIHVTEPRRSLLFFVTPREQLPNGLIERPMQRRPTTEEDFRAAKPPVVPPFASEVPPALGVPKLNWRAEANESAGNAIRAQQAADGLKFSEASKRPKRRCVKPKAPEWRNETPKYGFAGGLPYMRFHDDRCILVLLFVGCAFGAKPQSESHLFDHMGNYPNDSSVPDLDECEE